MSEVDTLEYRIRNKAEKDLRDKMTQAAVVFKHALSIFHNNMAIEIDTDEGTLLRVNTKPLIETIVKMAFNREKDGVGNDAIAAFITKVETLQADLDELRDNVENTHD